MNLQHLRQFLAVVESGSLRSAALSLGVSQPSLSKNLSALEGSLDVRLLLRTTRGISLTPAGQDLHERAKTLLLEVDRTRAAVMRFGHAKEGLIRFGVSTVPLFTLTAEVLAEFRARHPGYALHMTSGLASTLLPSVREGRLDFAIMPVAEQTELHGMNRTRLVGSRPVIAGRAGHPLASARSVKELRNCEWVMSGSPGLDTSLQGSVARLFAEQGLGAPRLAVTTTGVLDCLPLVAATDWLTPLPGFVLESSLLVNGLVRFRVAEALPAYDIYLVHRMEPNIDPGAARLAAMFISLSRIAFGSGQRHER